MFTLHNWSGEKISFKKITGFKGAKYDLSEKNLFCAPGSYHKRSIFSVDSVNKLRDSIVLEKCKNGFHFCKKMKNVLKFYRINMFNFFFQVEGRIETISDSKKSCTRELLIKKIIPYTELFETHLKVTKIKRVKLRKVLVSPKSQPRVVIHSLKEYKQEAYILFDSPKVLDNYYYGKNPDREYFTGNLYKYNYNYYLVVQR